MKFSTEAVLAGVNDRMQTGKYDERDELIHAMWHRNVALTAQIEQLQGAGNERTLSHHLASGGHIAAPGMTH